MSDKDKKLKLDLDFLGENAPEKSEKKHEPKKEHHKPEHKTPEDDAPMSNTTKGIIGACVVAGLLIFIALASTGDSSSSATTSGNTLPPPSNTQDLDSILNTNKAGTNSYVPVAERTKTANQICKDEYGTQAYSTGQKDSSGDPVCDCNDGYQWNSGQTACVAVPATPKVQTPLEICQERNGSHAGYESSTNSCTCQSGYSLSASSNQCVDALQARDDSCSAQWPNTSFLKYDTTTGKNVCDCDAGYSWNNDQTACYTAAAYTKSCVDSYGTGSVSTVTGGKRYCDCGYGYAFNPGRTMCVTTASINAICERDVGRNSRYAGTSSGGTYDCTEPY
ncbi:hypothetical protein K8R04_00050 [Candidatus Uhrbacteria bacterium]|nr:hypothetical protein [Candidatus Uhrbacteria bacterium]